MPKLKPDHIFVSDEEDHAITTAALSDLDNPPLPDENSPPMRPAHAVLPPVLYAALTDKSKPVHISLVTDEQDRSRQKHRGRSPLENPKNSTAIHIDADVVEAFKNTGEGWRPRINAILREAVQQGRI